MPTAGSARQLPHLPRVTGDVEFGPAGRL